MSSGPSRMNSKETPAQQRDREREERKLRILEKSAYQKQLRSDRKEALLRDQAHGKEMRKEEAKKNRTELHKQQELHKTQRGTKKNGGGIRKTRKHIKKRKGKTYRRCAKKNGKKTRKN